jgi:hypothetical protein
MSYKNDENLRSELESFYDRQSAEKAAEEIFEGEEILRENPAPGPSERLKAQIKTQIRQELMRQRSRRSFRLVYEMAAAAAVIFIVFAVSINLPHSHPVISPGTTVGFWDSNDTDIMVLTARVDQIEQELRGAQSTKVTGTNKADELESDLIYIDSDFWKG